MKQTTAPSTHTEPSNPEHLIQEQERHRLKKINHSEQQLKQLQKELDKLVDSITHNPSILSRAAAYWGAMSLWKKISIGLVILTPPLILAVLTQIITCYIITFLLLTVYTGGSLILDDHTQHTRHSTDQIKIGISSLAEGLNTILSVLEQIGVELTKQVNRFNKENDLFEQNIKELSLHDQQLTQEISALHAAEQQLESTGQNLALLCHKLKDKVATQTQLMEQTSVELYKVRQELDAVITELKTKTECLNETQNTLHNATQQHEQQVNILKDAVTQLQKAMQMKTKNDEKTEQLIQKMERRDYILSFFDKQEAPLRDTVQSTNHYNARSPE